MGLIKAAASAIGSTFHDQWKEVIRCDDMDNNTLMVKKTNDTGVLTKKSTIIVAPGQLAVIYDNGRIVDATAEEGVYSFDESTSPSFFAGQFGDVFKEMWERFTYGGGTAKQQAVFFFNLKEILDNKFGTPAPIPYGDWGHPVMNARNNSYIPLSVEIKCFGKYTFKIVDPAVFMRELAGTANIYTKEMVEDAIRTEVIGVFTNLLNSLSSEEHKVAALQLPNKTDEIKKMMDEVMYDEQIRRRGLSIISFISFFISATVSFFISFTKSVLLSFTLSLIASFINSFTTLSTSLTITIVPISSGKKSLVNPDEITNDFSPVGFPSTSFFTNNVA